MIRGKRSFRSVRVAVPMLLLAMLLALGVTACGDSTSEDSGSTSATNSSDTSSDSSSGDSGVVEAKGEITSEDVETGTAFTGGKAGKASGEPIKVGLVVPVQGALAGPFFPPTAKSAVTLVNDHLGGVGGRPLELVECTFGGTAEQGQACGAKMANDPDVKAVLYIPGAAGTQEFHAALDGKKVSLCSLATPTETKVPNQFCISAGAMALAAAATYIKDELNAKTVATVLPDDPAFRELARSQKETFESLGIEQTFGFIPPQATDVTAAITASKAQTADVVLLELPSPAACVPVAKALEQLGIDKPTISNPPSCLDPSVEKALGEKPAWTYQAFGPTVYAPGDQRAEVQLWADTLKTYERFGEGRGTFSEQLFGSVLLLTKVFNELGPDGLETDAIADKIEAYPGPAFLGDPTLKFGTEPFPTVGTLRVQYIEHHEDGTWTQAAGGKWFGPPPPADPGA